MIELSIITTLYRSAPYLEEFYRRTVAVADQVAASWELVLVNDGSPDNALELALALREQDPRIVVIDLSRNFGHHPALMTGLGHTSGERIFMIDCDLEEAPELLAEFDAAQRRDGADVVYGVQDRRKGKWFERLSGDLFFTLFNHLSSVPIPRNVILARLMLRPYVEALLQHRERELFLAGLWILTGFRQLPVTVVKSSKGESSYTLRRKLTLLTNSITSFSNRPLVYIFYIGLFISLVSSAYIANLIIRKTFFLIPVDGWTSLIVSIWFLGGLMILFLGVIGIYLSRIFIEVKQRPLTIVRKVYGKSR